MPTYFARKFTRKAEHVGRAEKTIGMVILALTAVIVIAFAYTASTNTDYLFRVDPALQGCIEEPRELTVARQMLPPLGDPAWRLAAGPTALFARELATRPAYQVGLDSPIAGLSADLTAALNNFGASWVYCGRYRADGPPAQEFIAVVCDMNTPAQAFGVCHARRPDGAAELTPGLDGWQDADGALAGFCQGRYYTELFAAAPLIGATTLPAVADAIAARQVDYGRPFSEEQLLPPQGRVPGTLRYVHRGALGVDGFDHVFLVELAGDTTAWVADMAGPRAAERLREKLTSSAPPPERPGRYGEQGEADISEPDSGREGPLTLIPWGGRVMAVFSSGRHVLGALSPDQPSAVAAAMSAYALIGPVAGESATPTSLASTTDEAENPFPSAQAAGWRLPQQISRYTPENLYIKIDGRAGLYLQYHVVGLTFGSYILEADTARTIDVYWYDMGEPQNALGIFRAEAAPDADAIDFAPHGYATGGAVFFIKGGDYVQVLPGGIEPDDATAAMHIARGIADQIEDTGRSMWAESVLPAEARVPGSIDFIAENAFSLDFLTEVYTAKYKWPEGEFTLFVHRAADDAAAKTLFDQYVQAIEDFGRIVWRSDDAARPLVVGNTAGMIDAVFFKGRYLAGVAGARDADAARRAAERFQGRLDSP
ncbi:MAG: hypothetical protein JSU68_06395 [Phycisphaerales bacterium]|nr:MAG: hypothetical protein JSU68_06395 [Phycisphaerales bacterium]